MKKYILTTFALAAAISCSKMGSETVQQPTTPSEHVPGIEYEKLTVNTGNETKTSLNGSSCAWSDGDSFKVFADQSSYASANTFSMTAQDSFEGEVPVGTEDFYAVYGSVSSASGTNGFTASVTIPTTQAAVANSFDPAAHIAVSHGTRTPGSTEPVNVSFRTFNRLIKISVPANVTSVVLSSNTAIAGTMTLSCTSEGVLSMNGNASEGSVTLSNGGTVIPEGNYYLCVAPVNMEGFQMTYTFTDGSTYTKSAAKTLEMAASNQIRNLAVASFPLSLEGFQTSYTYYLANDKSTANSMGSNEIKAGVASVPSLIEGQTLSLECNGAILNSINTGNTINENATTKGNGTYVYRAYLQNKDGFVTDEKVITSYVTGLPVHDACPKKDTWPIYANISSWSYGTTGGNGVLYDSNGYIQRNFYIPASTQISIKHTGKGRKGTLASSTTFKIYSGNNEVYSKNVTNTSGDGERMDFTVNGELHPDNNSVKCTNSYRNAASTYMFTFSIEILYR